MQRLPILCVAVIALHCLGCAESEKRVDTTEPKEIHQENLKIGLRKRPFVSFQFTRMPLRSALEIYALKINKKIEVSPEVQGDLAMEISDVHWRLALEIMIKTVGAYSVVEESNKGFTVAPTNASESQLGTTIIRLKHVRGNDPRYSLIEALQVLISLTPSPVDSVQYDTRVNAIILRATPSTIRDIKNAIKVIDREDPPKDAIYGEDPQFPGAWRRR